MRLRVLIADPDEMLLAAYRAFLAGEGVDVRTVTNGLDCLDALRRGQPDVLVLDPDLPRGSGLDVLAVLGENIPPVPVLILTSHPERVTESGVPLRDYALLIKPVPPAVVAGVMGTLAESRWSRRVQPTGFGGRLDAGAPGSLAAPRAAGLAAFVQPTRSDTSPGAPTGDGNHAPGTPDEPAQPARHLGGR
jgi:CheY-like chemotaxis protein